MKMLRSISKILFNHRHKHEKKKNSHSYSSFSSSSSSSIQKLIVLFLVLIINSKIWLCTCTSLQPNDEEEEEKKAEENKAHLFLFGDSFFDAGNNNYINTSLLDRADFWPYGITFFNFSTGRFSDGRLISDFIAEYAKLPLIPPYLQPGRNNGFSFGVNFASAGAGALVDTFKGYVINLEEQLKNFKKVIEEERRNYSNMGKLVKTRKKVVKRAVYLFSVGTNDYTSPLLMRNSTSNHLASSLSKSEYVNMVIGNASLVIREIYKIGGRKFGFVNVPPTGCLPAIRRIMRINSNKKIYDRRRYYCHKEASSYAVLHNRALYGLLRELKSELRDFKFSLFDIHAALLRRINQPYRYGFKEGNTACCGAGELRGTFSCGGRIPGIGFELCNNVKDYVFWDSFHLTEKAYEQLARQMWIKNTHNNINTITNYLKYSFFQYSVKDLFSLP